MPHPAPHPPPEPLQDFVGLAPALNDELTALDTLRTEYLRRRDSGAMLQNVVEAMRIELTYHSNAIEGSTLSLRETQLVIEGQTPPGTRPLRELYEARNHDLALRLIERWAESRSPDSLAESDVLEVHHRVLADIDPAGAGRFRSDRVLIAGTRFVPPGSQKFAALIPAMLALASRPGIHPALRSAELHYNLVAVHPFVDGNGRTARLLMNDRLLRAGFPLAIVEITDRPEYLEALDEANSGRCERFAQLLLRVIDRSIRRYLGPSGPS